MEWYQLLVRLNDITDILRRKSQFMNGIHQQKQRLPYAGVDQDKPSPVSIK